MSVHQHDAGLGLSRRRPPRGQLLHGAADRPRRRRDGHRPLRAAPPQPDQAEARSPTRPSSGMQYDSGDFPAVFERALELADLKGFKQRKRESEEARQAARPRHRQLSRSHRAAEQGDGRHPLRAERRRHHHHRHARLRPGPRRAVRAGADREARRAVRAHQAAAGRQRRAARGRRHRRLALDVCERHRDRRRRRRRSSRRASRSRASCSKPRPATSSSRDGRFTIAGTDRSIGIMELAEKLRAA